MAPGPPQNNVSPLNTTFDADVVEAAAPGRVARSVQYAQLVAASLQQLARDQEAVGLIAGPDDIPQHRVGVVQQHRRVDGVAQRHRGVDVVVVAVRQHDGLDPSTAQSPATIGAASCAASKTNDLAVVADQPDVVGDLPLAAVEGEDAVGGDQFDRHSTTTLRNTSPRSILWNASSTASSEIVSLTNLSSGRRPC